MFVELLIPNNNFRNRGWVDDCPDKIYPDPVKLPSRKLIRIMEEAWNDNSYNRRVRERDS